MAAPAIRWRWDRYSRFALPDHYAPAFALGLETSAQIELRAGFDRQQDEIIGLAVRFDT